MKNLLALAKQLLKYQSAAILCGGIDYGLMILLIEAFQVHYLVASLVSLLTAMAVQYLLNVRFVFDTDGQRRLGQFAGYVILGLIGIGLNQLIIFTAVHYAGLHYLPGKVCASVLVGIYNFITRKFYLERLPSHRRQGAERDRS